MGPAKQKHHHELEDETRILLPLWPPLVWSQQRQLSASIFATPETQLKLNLAVPVGPHKYRMMEKRPFRS